ncbi:MAG: RagB/SusD family nutrient uptake outer membrane protein [Flavobacteriaceae bacterium]
MKLNNIIKTVALSSVAWFALSCDVDRIPETTITDPAFWNNESDLKAAANTLYLTLPGLPETDDTWSDDAYGTSSNDISDGSRLTPGSDGFYGDQYVVIRRANNILEKSQRVIDAGVSQDIVDIYNAEARFFRAWSYFNLLQRYGGVPLILKTLTENAPELQDPKSSREEILAVIYADLDFAASKLKAPSAMASADYGRITATAAMAFKSRVALFEGTRAKFYGEGDAQKHLTIAKQAAKAVMDSGEHGIFPDYFNLFQYEGEGPDNPENIIVRQYGKSIEESIASHVTQRNLETGAANPTKALADSYVMTDGLPMDKSPLYAQPTTTVEVFNNRDPRMLATFFKTGDDYIGTKPVFTVPDINFQRTGFANRRYANITDWQNSRSYIDRTVLRYAEVLLNYAEATFELDDDISDADLNLSINKLRSRASVSLPALTNAFVAANTLSMRYEIRRERRVELALEGFRYWDLIRWKIAEFELTKAVLGNKLFDDFNLTAAQKNNIDQDENGNIILQKANLRVFDAGKDYLFPFPTDQLGLNPNLEQNPKW